MASIFLSYSREDRPFAENLARALESANHEVWWDRHIASGREFSGEIEAALEKADLVLVAWSKHAAKSPWVRDEAGVGRDSGRLFPILIDDSQPPLGFRQFQAFDLAGWKGRNGDPRTDELIQSVEAHLKGSAAPLLSRRRWRLAGAKLGWAVAAALTLIIAAAIAVSVIRANRAEAEPASLAVLPFKNMSSGDPYFAEGVAEEILNQLAREPQFKVAGRTSAAMFKDAADVRDVGRRLHVAYVLEGSVRSAGQQVRVDVTLVDTRRGMRLWTQNFHGKLDDIFAIQDTIGQQVATHLRRQLIRTAATMTTRGDVYSLYLTARGLIRDRQPATMHTAVELAQRAVKLDPNYAPAWAALAQAERAEGLMSPTIDATRERWKWLRDAQHAVKLAPNSAEAHNVMAIVLSTFGDKPKAIAMADWHLKRAAQLDPNNAEIWNVLAQDYEWKGDYPRALAAWRRAYQIDPLWGGAFPRTINFTWSMGHHDESDAIARRIARDSLSPADRIMVRADMLGNRGDLSGEYKLRKAAFDIATPGERSILQGVLANGLRTLGYFEQGRSQWRTFEIGEPIWRMWFGQAPSPQKVAEFATDPRLLWDDGSLTSLLLRTLVRNNRSPEAVRLYDLRFRSPDDMAKNYSGAHADFLNDAAVTALALRNVGRREDSDRLLALADGAARQRLKGGEVPSNYHYWCAQLWAVMGRRDEAIGALQQGVKRGWFYGTERFDSTSFRDIAEEPAFRDLLRDSRFQRIRNNFAAHLARERRELGPIPN